MTDPDGWDKDTSPFHRGERALHDRLGIADRQESIGRKIVRPFMPDQHREFYAQLPFFVTGSVDNDGQPWASVLFGEPGFVSTPTDRSLNISARPISGDPLADNLKPGAPVGFLGVEMPTRRRNRVNGVVSASDAAGLKADVVQSFGNCPQYIQTRAIEFVRDPNGRARIEAETFHTLDNAAVELIAKSDTFFVASHNNEDDIRDTGGVDVNHRGGQPGFVKIEGDTLTIPDYVGNFAFNTLGNFLINPKAGLLFIDFDTGDLLLLTGTTETLWDPSPEVRAFRGAERAWQFKLTRGVRLKNAAPLRWTFGELSPNSALTGNWQDATRTLAAAEKREAWRPFRVARIVDESAAIRSFYLEPADGDGLLPYQSGQFLTVRVSPDGADAPLIRTYTLSSSPSDSLYRLSIKREGVVSGHLHEALKPGDLVEAKAPRGSFTFDTSESRPAVLIAGGVGITPMIAMTRHAVSDAVRLRHMRSVAVFHAVTRTKDRAFLAEFNAAQNQTQGNVRYISIVGNPGPGEQSGRDFHFAGRITPQMLQHALPLADYDVYLCGPPAFMQAVYDMVRGLGVNDARIFAESFGPSSLVRQPDQDTDVQNTEQLEDADTAIVSFAKSGFEQPWTPEEGTLLELAEAHGLAPNYACRNGICGTCAVKVKAGKVAYRETPTFQTGTDEALICCARPAKGSDKLELHL